MKRYIVSNTSDDLFITPERHLSKSRILEMKRSFNSTLMNAQDNAKMLRKELEKHSDDIHTSYIKDRLKKSEAIIKEYKNKLKELERYS